jgi:hypothetical protein
MLALTILLGLALVASIILAVFVARGTWRIFWATVALAALIVTVILLWPGNPLNRFWFPPTGNGGDNGPVSITAIVLPACPPSAGKNPVTGTELISKLNPYPGVACEYEYVNLTDPVTVTIPAGQAALIADWGVTCPTGPVCEGTWLATSSFRLPAGILAHVYLYVAREAAEGRFPSFACEYVATPGHTMENIRVPGWAAGMGTILQPSCGGIAAVVPTTVIAPVAPCDKGTYAVQPGDTLSKIAQGLGINWQNLADRNGVTSPYVIRAGQILCWP